MAGGVMMSDAKEKLKDLFHKRAQFYTWDDIQEDREAANGLAEQVIKLLTDEGWQAPRELFVEEWRAIPGYSFWEMSNRYSIRHKSGVYLEVCVAPDEPIQVTIYNDLMTEITCLLQDLIELTWPSEQPKGALEGLSLEEAKQLFNEPGTLTGKTTPVIIEEPTEPTWIRIPEFENYEINPVGDVRNRFTRRVLDVTVEGSGKYVEMHDKEGFTHFINVGRLESNI
jgi:hypothetical protein